TMLCSSHKFDLPDGLSVAAKCYRKEYTQDGPRSPNGVTLVLAHCSSGHKEQWEPVLLRLFELCSQSAPCAPQVCIREAWALDAQNHGDSALLNKTALQRRQPITIQEYGSMLAHFAQSDLVKGHELVAVGHSASTSAWTIACAAETPPPLCMLILVEPVMVTPPLLPKDPRVIAGRSNTASVMSRKESWSDYADLAAYMGKRYPWKVWDKGVMETYLKYGFVEVMTSGTKTVMPKSLNVQEVGFYEPDDHILAGTLGTKVCSRYVVHVLFGERPEMVSLESRESICDGSQGRTMTSISIVPQCGHLAVQENPCGVADAIFTALRTQLKQKRSARL
ncbi:hypothetical protein C8Q80DRAFT_1115322, partial [Daedaleopsis nitida]